MVCKRHWEFCVEAELPMTAINQIGYYTKLNYPTLNFYSIINFLTTVLPSYTMVKA